MRLVQCGGKNMLRFSQQQQQQKKTADGVFLVYASNLHKHLATVSSEVTPIKKKKIMKSFHLSFQTISSVLH